MDIKEHDSNVGVHRKAKLSAGSKCTSFKNIYIPGMLPVDDVCNDAFVPLEGAVSPSRGKYSIIFDHAVKVTCSVKLYMQVKSCT